MILSDIGSALCQGRCSSVLPVFKELNSILFYPVQYEGEDLAKGKG